MIQSKENLRKVFENGDKPKQEDFWDWQDSYWHKDEKIPATSIVTITADTNLDNLTDGNYIIGFKNMDFPTITANAKTLAEIGINPFLARINVESKDASMTTNFSQRLSIQTITTSDNRKFQRTNLASIGDNDIDWSGAWTDFVELTNTNAGDFIPLSGTTNDKLITNKLIGSTVFSLKSMNDNWDIKDREFLQIGEAKMMFVDIPTFSNGLNQIYQRLDSCVTWVNPPSFIELLRRCNSQQKAEIKTLLEI